MRRHGLARVTIGASDPGQVAGYLGGRAEARQLDPVTVRETRTLGQTLDSIERQLFSWTWPYTPEQVRAVCGDIRAWAAREDFPMDAGYQVESDIRWWAFELPG